VRNPTATRPVIMSLGATIWRPPDRECDTASRAQQLEVLAVVVDGTIDARCRSGRDPCYSPTCTRRCITTRIGHVALSRTHGCLHSGLRRSTISDPSRPFDRDPEKTTRPATPKRRASRAYSTRSSATDVCATPRHRRYRLAHTRHTIERTRTARVPPRSRSHAPPHEPAQRPSTTKPPRGERQRENLASTKLSRRGRDQRESPRANH